MSTVAAHSMNTSFAPFDLQSRSLTFQTFAVLVGTLVLALSSYISVPMIPVPFTMQTYAVAMVGALFGWRLGGITVLAWLAEAALGAPVLAGGHAGLAAFAGPTAGYLFAFPAMAMLMGFLAERGWNGRNMVLAALGMLLSHALCLLGGATWLSVLLGMDKAIAVGVMPFLGGAVIKSLLGATTLALLVRRTQK